MTRRTYATATCTASTLLLIAALPALTGCYRHVVSASGPNAESYDLHEPNNPNQKAVPQEKRTYRFPNRMQPQLQ